MTDKSTLVKAKTNYSGVTFCDYDVLETFYRYMQVNLKLDQMCFSLFRIV